MPDQCKYCIVRGDYKKCLKTPCSKHESWIDIERMDRIKQMLGFIQDISDGGGFIGVAAMAFLKELEEREG